MTAPDEATAVVEDEGDAGQCYVDKVNAPLSPEVIAALRAQLESGEYARYRSPRRGEDGK